MLTSTKLYSFFLYLVAILFIPALALAENSPVKSIDESGHVTYSDNPVENAKNVSKISIEKAPNESEIKAAQQQASQKISTANKIKLPHEVKKNNNPVKKTPSKKIDSEHNTINSGSSNRWPYGAIPRPLPKPPIARPPGQRQGINPPPANRPGARAGRR